MRKLTAEKIMYISIALSILYMVLPKQLKVQGYGSVHGWIWLLVVIPVMFISYLWLSYRLIKNKEIKEFYRKTAIFVAALLIQVGLFFLYATIYYS